MLALTCRNASIGGLSGVQPVLSLPRPHWYFLWACFPSSSLSCDQPYSAQRSTNAYPPHTESQVVNDVLTATRDFRSLRPDVRPPPPRPGSSSAPPPLLCLHGTLPVVYQGATYNIPVELLLTVNHPLHPPLAYVRPTHAMVIAPQHRHVDVDGKVYLPYLSEWVHPRSNLSELLREMASVFGAATPVLSRTTPPIQPPDEPRREALLRQLAARTAARLREVSDGAAAELSRLSAEREQLLALDREVGVSLDRLSLSSGGHANDPEATRRRLAALRAEDAELSAWLAANAELSKEVDVDKLVVAGDVPSAQLLDARAEDLALSDARHLVSEAFHQERIGLDAFLRETRKLSREQYMARALVVKIKKVQRQRAAAAGGAPGSGGGGGPPGRGGGGYSSAHQPYQ